MKGLLALFLAMTIECVLLALMNLLYAKWQPRRSTQQEPTTNSYLHPEARQ